MVFTRIKKVRGRLYAYAMESYRNQDGEPRNRIVRYLGPLDPAPPASPARFVDDAVDPRGKSPEQRREGREEARENARIDGMLRSRRF